MVAQRDALIKQATHHDYRIAQILEHEVQNAKTIEHEFSLFKEKRILEEKKVDYTNGVDGAMTQMRLARLQDY
jgi:hypothetical protein